jgi:AcrR family transcriptional regulator
MARDTLTLERIVEVAVELLDSEGLEGLNMRALGRRLGSAATAVYWHVGGKDYLIGLVADQVWNEIALPDLAAVDWRTAASQMGTELHAMLTRHPWLVQAFGSYAAYGPGKARYDDHSLAIFEAAGFPGPDADRAMATVFTFVLGNALGPAAEASLMRRFRDEGGDPEDIMRDTMATAREVAARFPRLRARFGSAAAEGYAAVPEKTFEFGLNVILDGLEDELASRRRASDWVEH